MYKTLNVCTYIYIYNRSLVLKDVHKTTSAYLNIYISIKYVYIAYIILDIYLFDSFFERFHNRINSLLYIIRYIIKSNLPFFNKKFFKNVFVLLHDL